MVKEKVGKKGNSRGHARTAHFKDVIVFTFAPEEPQMSSVFLAFMSR